MPGAVRRQGYDFEDRLDAVRTPRERDRWEHHLGAPTRPASGTFRGVGVGATTEEPYGSGPCGAPGRISPEQSEDGQAWTPVATRVAAASGSSTNSKEEHSLSVAVETAGGEGEFVLKPDARSAFTARSVGLPR